MTPGEFVVVRVVDKREKFLHASAGRVANALLIDSISYSCVKILVRNPFCRSGARGPRRSKIRELDLRQDEDHKMLLGFAVCRY